MLNSSIMYASFALYALSLLPACLSQTVPQQAQVVNQKSFNALSQVLPPTESNDSTIFIPPGLTAQAASAKPFHIYNEAFYDIIGPNPTLTVIASTGIDPIYHEAVVWIETTEEVWFVQNAGAKASGTGLNKSAIIEKISLSQLANVGSQRNVSGQINVTTVNTSPKVINPNGGTRYQGGIVYTTEGQGDNIAPGLQLVNVHPPYNSTVLLNNYYGRQFSSLNDVNVHPVNKDIYFTDTLYGYWQAFRPEPGLPNQVYRFTPSTGAVAVVADGFDSPNGLTFSPNGSYAYVTDTGVNHGFVFGNNDTRPQTIYRYTVESDGSFSNRKVFAMPTPGIPDGIHCDTNGNVYTGVGDGVQVFSPEGVLLGKIFLGTTSANFNFAGNGRMIICSETELWYAQIAAEGAYVAGE